MHRDSYTTTLGLTTHEHEKTWKQVYVIGDIHGDLAALVQIFLGLDLIDQTGQWSAPADTLVVLLGDLIDRGGDSANLVAYMMSLQDQAQQSESYVELLLGNHELMAAVGDYRYLCPEEGASLNDLWIADLSGPSAVFRGSSQYAQWLKSRPLMVQVGDSMLVHAGLGEWAKDKSITAVNAIASRWMGYFQGTEPAPPDEGQWIIGDDGPLWTRKYAWTHSNQPAQADSISGLLDIIRSHGCRRMLVGHCPTLDIMFLASTCHPQYGDAVVNLDTGISACFEGRLSALEIGGERDRIHYFRRARNTKLVNSIRAFGEAQRRSLTDYYAACA